MSGLVRAVAGSVAGVAFFFASTGNHGPGALLAAARPAVRGALVAEVGPAPTFAGALDESAPCAKCHSACENGRSHLGLPAPLARGAAGLPLDDEGRAACVTCHDASVHGIAGAAGHHLRISNQRRELCLACHLQDPEAAPGVTVLSPPERSVFLEDRLALIGRSFRLEDADLTVRLNGSAFHLDVRQGDFFTWLTLQDGVNRIEIAHRDRLLWRGEVFHGAGFPGGYGRASSGHRTGNREQCLSCHGSGEASHAAIVDPAPGLCFGCHEHNDEKRYVHGPLAVGDCLVCHDPHGGFGAAHLRQERELLCGNCHASGSSGVAASCRVSGKGCVDCHDPHQSDRRYLLKGPQYTMR